MVLLNPSSICLKRGHTYLEYIIKRNEVATPYADICAALGLTFYEARAIYDGISALELEDIGTLKKSALSYAVTTPSKFQHLRCTGRKADV
jgi:hypothetical protein